MVTLHISGNQRLDLEAGMPERSWQYFRDKSSRLTNIAVVKKLVEVLRYDTTCYMLNQIGHRPKDVLRYVDNSFELRARIRDIHATCCYLEQFEESAIVRNWFLGIQPSYDEQSPLDLFRNGEGDIIVESMKAGTRLFAVSA